MRMRRLGTRLLIQTRNLNDAHTQKLLASDADLAATSVLNKWQESGETIELISSQKQMQATTLQALTDELLIHIDKEAKDRKMQVALGISGCTTDGCRAQIESPYSKTSLKTSK